MKREMTLDNFHVYEGNKVAFLAVQKILEFPGELFNPLYIHGGTGIGKTHIAWALFHALSQKGDVLFFTAKDFEQYLQQKKPLDVPLIVDDIHCIDQGFHDMLLGTIDRYLTNNVQLCFTGNAAPRELKNFSDKILSRLEGGLVCDIQPPKEMALVELIKKKSGEAGILLPDEVALELAQISTGSIRTIEGMINRLVAYSSLGNFSLDVNTVHMILKEFYPKGIYSPVSSLLEELKKNASEVLQDVSTKLDIRDEYRERIYVWQMKGFDTASLMNLLEGDVDVLKREYDVFIAKVQRLIELQKQYGALDLQDHPDEAMQIESMLFSPERVDEIEALIKQFSEKPVCVDPSKSFTSYITGPCNERALEIYQKQVRENLGERYNPFIILGDPGVGKTRFLEAVFLDLQDLSKNVYFCDCSSSQTTCNWDTVSPYDIIILDNFHVIVKSPEPVHDIILEVVKKAIENKKAVILSCIRVSDVSKWGENIRQLFEMGIEVEILHPDPATVIDYIEPRLTPMQYEQAINQGLPEFSSYQELEAYITSIAGAPQEVVPLEPVETTQVEKTEEPSPPDEVETEDKTLPVSLGLPGEEELPAEVETTKTEITPLGLPGETSEDTEQETPGIQQPPQSTEVEQPVSLGLPGEESQEIHRAEETTPVAEILPETDEKPAVEVEVTEPLKTIHEERFIVNDITGELIEDNY
jgi:chromosomal replication initiation ATPase DnaA